MCIPAKEAYRYPENYLLGQGAFHLCQFCNGMIKEIQTRKEKELILQGLGYVRHHSSAPQADSIWYPKGDKDENQDPAFFVGSKGVVDRALDRHWGYDDWLMPLVEEIEQGDFGFKMCRKRVEVYIDSTKETIVSVKEDCRINSLFKAIVEFIKWQNKKNEQQISNSNSNNS